MKKVFLYGLFCILIAGCASSRMSTISTPIIFDYKIETIALSPSGGLLADAIGVELFNRGFNIVDTNSMSQLMVRLNLSELEITQPQNLKLLEEQGIDVYLSVKSVAAYDGLPQSASVRMNSARNGKVIGGVSWQNGWGGQAGSIVDRAMRKDIAEAAIEITEALVKQLRQ